MWIASSSQYGGEIGAAFGSQPSAKGIVFFEMRAIWSASRRKRWSIALGW
jgi:hypothetical protein